MECDAVGKITTLCLLVGTKFWEPTGGIMHRPFGVQFKYFTLRSGDILYNCGLSEQWEG